MRIVRIRAAAAIICATGLVWIGCGKKDAEITDAGAADPSVETTAEEGSEAAPPAAAAPGAETIPGESAVRSAMERKDYDAAVASLLNMRGTLRREQWNDFLVLQGEVREQLMVAAETEPKAQAPLMTLRAVMSGR